jgi:ribonucleoside-diphosphate reductase alpha chain
MGKCSVTTGSGKIIADVEFPDFWSENARIQVAEKYFRRADVPQFPEGILDRHQAQASGIDWKKLPTGPEKSLKRVINRLAGALAHWGWMYGYFSDEEERHTFYSEMAYMMIHQYGALNSPQWFNTGLHWAYGIEGDAKGQYYYDFNFKQAVPSRNGFEHPQAHACFILGVRDDLFGPNGIFDTAQREAKIFYFGSGAGSNYSTLRGKGEPVSGGGVSSGMMSFLDVFDIGGGVIKSGGKTRRAAKMDICSDTHPELIEFIQWKMRQEKMVRILIEAGMSGGFEDEAYRTVRGMNSNNTVALSHDFFRAVRTDDDWHLRWVTDPSHISKTLKARDIWDEIVYATWFSADPGIHATDTINEWNTCINDERIVSSNPCSEYVFLNETSCNLASINLIKFYDATTRTFNTDKYKQAIRLWQLALDITVSMAQYPAKDICEKTVMYRTTGLGYTNLGGLLMMMGLGYASTEAHQVAGAITAILGGEAYAMSAEIAGRMGAYDAFARNSQSHLRVVRNHRRACYSDTEYAVEKAGDFEGITKKPQRLDLERLPARYWSLVYAARQSWDDAVSLGTKYGFRNAQTTVLAPTGTISFAMDADTFGIEPDYALIKYKALAGGGYAVIVNRLIEPALEGLGYDASQIRGNCGARE